MVRGDADAGTLSVRGDLRRVLATDDSSPAPETARSKVKRKPRVLIAKPWNPTPSPQGFYM
jgi:hypothetical protein